MIVSSLTRFSVFVSAGLLPSLFSLALDSRPCRILPSDDAWPDDAVWDTFNASVDGRLIRIVPEASPCHDPDFDEARCKDVRETWFIPQFQFVVLRPFFMYVLTLQLAHSLGRPGSIMNSVFYNQSCDLFTSRDEPCTMENSAEYSVDISQAEHVVKAVRFVKEHNIRFIVKNTGHEYVLTPLTLVLCS